MSEPNRKRRWYRLTALLLLLLLGYGTYRVVRPDPNLKKVQQLREDFATHAKEWTPDRAAREGQADARRDGQAVAGPAGRHGRRGPAALPAGVGAVRQDVGRPTRPATWTTGSTSRSGCGSGSPGRTRRVPGRGRVGAGPVRGRSRPVRRVGWPWRATAASPEERERRRKERLDRTTPEFRARMDQFRKDMNARRQQRGLPPVGPPVAPAVTGRRTPAGDGVLGGRHLEPGQRQLAHPPQPAFLQDPARRPVAEPAAGDDPLDGGLGEPARTAPRHLGRKPVPPRGPDQPGSRCRTRPPGTPPRGRTGSGAAASGTSRTNRRSPFPRPPRTRSPGPWRSTAGSSADRLR